LSAKNEQLYKMVKQIVSSKNANRQELWYREERSMVKISKTLQNGYNFSIYQAHCDDFPSDQFPMTPIFFMEAKKENISSNHVPISQVSRQLLYLHFLFVGQKGENDQD